MQQVQRVLAALLTVAVVLAAAGAPGPARAASSPFTDVIGGPYDPAVGWLFSARIVNGRTATTYAPHDPVTRAEMAALLVRALGKGDEAARYQVQTSFRDVLASHWAAGAIALASQLNLVRGGSDGRFRPADPVTYKEAATMLVRAAGYETFVTGDWPASHILKANDLGILAGTRFAMDGLANRGDVAQMLYNWILRVPHPVTQKTLNQTLYKVPASIKLQPEGEHLAPGRTRVRAVVLDAAGRDLDLAATLTATGGTVSAGRLTIAPGTATVTVTARVGEVSASRTYRVVTDLKVEPAETAVAPGGKVTLRATATGADGAREAVRPVWSVAGDAIIDDAGVVEVAAGASWPVLVTASLGELEATARVNVATTLAVSPASPVVAAGQSLTLTAALPGGVAASGVTWTADGGARVSAGGVFTAPAPGLYTVTARLGSATGSATVLVPDSLTVEPASAALQPGGTQPFRALARYGSGEPVPVNATWSASVGTINPASGEFSAGQAPGSGQVTAAWGSLRATAAVTVAGQPARVALTLTDTSLPANGTATTRLGVRLVDARGVTVPVAQAVTLAAAGAAVTLPATVVVTEQGEAWLEIRAGTTAGAATITAQAGTLQPGTAVITLMPVQAAAPRIRLAVAPAAVGTGTGLAMPTATATLVDSANNPVNAAATQTVNLTLAGTGVLVNSASITIPQGQSSGSTTLYINAATPGALTVTGSAAVGVEPAALTITIAAAGPAARILVVPAHTLVPADGTTALPVDLYLTDAQGVWRQADAGIPVTLIVTTPAGATLPCTSCTGTISGGKATVTVPGQTAAGTYTLRAVAANTYTSDSVPVTFGTGGGSAGPATGMEIAATGAAAGSAATVQVRVKDANGNLVTTDNGRTITLLAAGTGVTVAPGAGASGSAATVGGVATFTLYSATAQTATLYASTTGLANPVQTGSVTWTAGSPGSGYRLRVTTQDGNTVRPVNLPFYIYADVVDANGNLISVDTGRTVMLSPSSGLATAQTWQAVTAQGRALFLVQGIGNGTVSFSAFSTDGLTSPTALAITFSGASTGGGTAARLRLEAAATTGVQVGQPVTLKARVLDSAGNPVTGDNGRTVLLAAPAGVNLFGSATRPTVAGEATFVVYPTAAGSFSLQAYSVSGNALTSEGAVTITASGTPATQAVQFAYLWDVAAAVRGQPATLYIYAADAANRVVWADNISRSVSLSNLTTNVPATLVPASALTSSGVAAFTVTPGTPAASPATLVLKAESPAGSAGALGPIYPVITVTN